VNLQDIQTIYDYHFWANGRILAATARVSPAQFLAPTIHNFGSLRGTLVHLLDSRSS
jgi:uncharacterized damage-inducible protein DinB